MRKFLTLNVFTHLQNYAIVGGRRSCRVALGADSNPMCFVHDSFRCVVIVPGEKLSGHQTPFLNRFEKHSLSYGDMMQPYHRKVALLLREWVESRCGKDEPGAIFLGYRGHETTLASLVLSQLPEALEPPAEVISVLIMSDDIPRSRKEASHNNPRILRFFSGPQYQR